MFDDKGTGKKRKRGTNEVKEQNRMGTGLCSIDFPTQTLLLLLLIPVTPSKI